MKRINRAIVTLFVSSTVCLSQTFNLSGVVKNSQGADIEGVTVRLGSAGLATLTSPDGSFSLTGTISGVRPPSAYAVSRKKCPFIVENNKLIFNVAEQSDVAVTAYDCKGKVLLNENHIVSTNDRNSINLPLLASGILIFRISMNNVGYTYKSVAGTPAFNLRVISLNPVTQDRRVKIAMQIDDALLFTKEGYQLYRIGVSNPNTSGISITLTPLVTGTVTDIDGNVYRTVRYGNQTWTVENLRTTKYNDGTGIPLVTDGATWSALTTPAYCFYEYTTDPAAQRIWGAFYNWYAINTGKLSPTGWHVPTAAEWNTLQNYLIASGYNFDGTTSENKIAKSLAIKTDWLESTDSGAIGNDAIKNNASGFSALANGYCEFTGSTYYRNWYAFWWTATEQDSTMVNLRCLSYYKNDLQKNAFTKNYGLSVRLVRDK